MAENLPKPVLDGHLAVFFEDVPECRAFVWMMARDLYAGMGAMDVRTHAGVCRLANALRKPVPRIDTRCKDMAEWQEHVKSVAFTDGQTQEDIEAIKKFQKESRRELGTGAQEVEEDGVTSCKANLDEYREMWPNFERAFDLTRNLQTAIKNAGFSVPTAEDAKVLLDTWKSFSNADELIELLRFDDTAQVRSVIVVGHFDTVGALKADNFETLRDTLDSLLLAGCFSYDLAVELAERHPYTMVCGHPIPVHNTEAILGKLQFFVLHYIRMSAFGFRKIFHEDGDGGTKWVEFAGPPTKWTEKNRLEEAMKLFGLSDNRHAHLAARHSLIVAGTADQFDYTIDRAPDDPNFLFLNCFGFKKKHDDLSRLVRALHDHPLDSSYNGAFAGDSAELRLLNSVDRELAGAFTSDILKGRPGPVTLEVEHVRAALYAMYMSIKDKSAQGYQLNDDADSTAPHSKKFQVKRFSNSSDKPGRFVTIPPQHRYMCAELHVLPGGNGGLLRWVAHYAVNVKKQMLYCCLYYTDVHYGQCYVLVKELNTGKGDRYWTVHTLPSNNDKSMKGEFIVNWATKNKMWPMQYVNKFTINMTTTQLSIVPRPRDDQGN